MSEPCGCHAVPHGLSMCLEHYWAWEEVRDRAMARLDEYVLGEGPRHRAASP